MRGRAVRPEELSELGNKRFEARDDNGLGVLYEPDAGG